MGTDPIIGRDREIAVINGFAERAPSGPQLLLIEGEAGIGKTTLLRECVRRCEITTRVLRSSPAETDSELPFTVLGDLVGEDVRSTMLDRLPVARRHALESALLLGGTDDPRPDARAIGLATLEVVEEIAAQQPLTIAIDDVQWMDAPSARALTFALRRVRNHQRISVITALRRAPGLSSPLSIVDVFGPNVRRLGVKALTSAELARLLRARVEAHLTPPLVDRVCEAAGGNPMFALAICQEITQHGELPAPDEPLPIPPDLDGLLRSRVGALAPTTREALLLLAITSERTAALLGIAGCPSDALDEAVDAGVIEVRGDIAAFTHPLFASSVYADATTFQRRAAHERLAHIVHAEEERAGHLALSAKGPKRSTALAVRRAAATADQRGAASAAAHLYLTAAKLTPDEDRADAWFARQMAAWNLFDAGDTAGARALIDDLLPDLPHGSKRANALHSRATMSWNDVRTVSRYEERALRATHDDESIESRVLSELAWVALHDCDLRTAATRAGMAHELAERADDDELRRISIPILALSSALSGDPRTDLLERALLLEQAPIHAEASSAATCLGRIEMWSGELDAARSTFERELARLRERGRETACWEVLTDLGELELRSGDWKLATEHTAEAREIAIESGKADVLTEIIPVETMLAAVSGRSGEARVRGLEGMEACDRLGDRWNEIRVRSALGHLELSLGDAVAADAWLEPLPDIIEGMELHEPGVFPFIPDAVEVAVALGDIDRAEALTDRLDDHGQALGQPNARAGAARCRALVVAARGDLADAAALLEDAEARSPESLQPFEGARTLLTLGMIRRRMKKKASARDVLQSARRTFRALGAPIWSEKADAELSRIGGRHPTPAGALSPTETEVAQLVARGHTNREVADALFMSPHSVDANLRRIYRKLGVRSRTELAAKF